MLIPADQLLCTRAVGAERGPERRPDAVSFGFPAFARYGREAHLAHPSISTPLHKAGVFGAAASQSVD